MTRRKQAITDERAELVLRELLQLSLTVRDEGPDAVTAQLDRLEHVARGNLRAALVIAAALVDPDRPIERWWQRGIPAKPLPLRLLPDPRPEQHGDHAAFNRHKKRDEDPCTACREGERAYQRERARTRRAAERRARNGRRRSAA